MLEETGATVSNGSGVLQQYVHTPRANQESAGLCLLLRAGFIAGTRSPGRYARRETILVGSHCFTAHYCGMPLYSATRKSGLLRGSEGVNDVLQTKTFVAQARMYEHFLQVFSERHYLICMQQITCESDAHTDGCHHCLKRSLNPPAVCRFHFDGTR